MSNVLRRFFRFTVYKPSQWEGANFDYRISEIPWPTLLDRSRVSTRHITSFSAKTGPLGVPLIWFVIKGQIPAIPHFCGLNRHFLAKRAKHENLHIIKVLHRCQPNFAQWWRPPNTVRGLSKLTFSKSNMADGRHLEKSINRDFSETAWPISMKYCMVIHIGPP